MRLSCRGMRWVGRVVLVASALAAACGALAAEDLAIAAERQGRVVKVLARATLQASPALVWQTLTDYDHLAEFIPGIASSRVIERHGPDTVVEQSGTARLLLFSYPIDVTVETRSQPPHVIEVRLLKGNLRQLEGAYRIEPLADGRLVLHWNGLIEPDLALPPLIGEFLMRANVEEQFTGMVREIERRAAAREASE